MTTYNTNPVGIPHVSDCSGYWQERVAIAPGAATIAELFATLLSIPTAKAEALAEKLTGQSNMLAPEMAWSRLRDMSLYDLKAAGLTQTQAGKFLAAVELGKRVFLAPSSNSCPIIDDPSVAASVLSYDLATSSVEKLAILILDIKHCLIAKEILTIGIATETLVPPREIFEKVLRYRGQRFIIAHCHPSGFCDPSEADLKITRQLLKVSGPMCLPLLDHLILGGGNYKSLRQATTLWEDHPQGD